MHRAVDAVELDVAWPEVAQPAAVLEPPADPNFTYIDAEIGKNFEQSKVCTDVNKISKRLLKKGVKRVRSLTLASLILTLMMYDIN